MLADKSRQITKWLKIGKQIFSDWLENSITMQSDLIGLVLNSDYIKILKIQTVNNKYTVDYFDIIKLPAGVVSKNAINDIPAVAKLLEDAFQRANLKTKNVAIAIPRSSAIVKTITLDNRLTEDEIESRVWIEANRLFPDLIGDIYLDFAITGPAQDPSQVEVIIIACRKNQLQPYLEVINLAGLKAKVVDINYYALERVLPIILQQSPQTKTSAILSISFSVIHLLVLQEGKLIYTHELNYDGSQLFKMVDENAINDSSSVSQVLKMHLGQHLKHAMQFFYTSRPNVWLDRIILADDCSAVIPGLAEFIQKEINKEVVLANPFNGMTLAAGIDQEKLAQYAPALLLCCGVAMSKMR